MRCVSVSLLGVLLVACPGGSHAVGAVVLGFDANAATETYAPGSSLNARAAVDAVYTGASRGWAISNRTGANGYASQAAVFPLIDPFDMVYPVTFSFGYSDPNGASQHILGRFELYATTADTPTASSDDSIWTLLTPTVASFSSTGGLQFSVNGGTVTYGGGSGVIIPATDSYAVTVDVLNLGAPITAFRLKALADANYPSAGPSLPSAGPGLNSNGNFVLSAFAATGSSNTLSADVATFIRSDQAATNFDGSSHGLITGSAYLGSPRIRSLLGFDMSTMADNPVFNRVELDLTIRQLDTSGSVLNGSTWELYGVTEDTVNSLFFTEDQATWNSRATGIAWNTAGGDIDTTLLASLTLDWEPVAGDVLTLVGTAALASAVRNAIEDDETLYFFLMQGDEGSNSARRFLFTHSESTGTVAQVPTLRLTQVPEPAVIALLSFILPLVAVRRRSRRT
ncbi:MAG: DNRLRE domain-containing protein [Patescibacteria group bacterium]|nr:DNRLRE domain-containing protein [Patescibacteria group bacterium]